MSQQELSRDRRNVQAWRVAGVACHLMSATLMFVFGCGQGSNSERFRDYSETAPTDDGPLAATKSPAVGADAVVVPEPADEVASGNSAVVTPPAETPSTGKAPSEALVTSPPHGASSSATAAGTSADTTNQPRESTTAVQNAVVASPAAAETRPGADTGVVSASATADPAAATTPAEPRTIELLIPEKVFRREKNSKAVRVSYDDIDLLKVLNMEPVPVNAVDHFPEWLKSLDGTTIRIRGFMYPTYEATGLEAFTLARDNGICCFVRQPKIYDIIAIEMASGVTTDYIEGKPFDVEGVFRIQPEADETELYRLYRIENARVLR